MDLIAFLVAVVTGCAGVVAYGVHLIAPQLRRHGGRKPIGGQSEHGKRRAG
ncbi:hypothetical protein ABZX90_37175 [Streptomyces sp. NPDC002935]|uniref:hypothetical protein n=1 Tax=Streptomyces sp. NPDC002935 TaxID=3154545 RepID=UPI0033BA580E